MAKKEKREAVSIKLVEIKETAFKLNAAYDCSDMTDENLALGMKQTFHADTENEMLMVEVWVSYKKMPEEVELADLSVMLDFRIPKLEESIHLQENNVQFNDEQLMLNLLSIAYGTLRGVLYARFKGTVLEKFPLPLISADYLKSLIKNNNNKTEK